MTNFRAQLTDYVNAAFSGIWIETPEPDQCQMQITGILEPAIIRSWDCASGINYTGSGKGDPLYPLAPDEEAADSNKTTVTLLHNFHRFINNTVVMQTLFNAIIQGKQTRNFFIVLSPLVDIPVELQKVFVVIQHPLPTAEELQTIALQLSAETDAQPVAPEAALTAAGLTHFEAEGTFSLSIAKHDQIRPDVIWDLKTQAIKKTGLLTIHKGTECFKRLGGMGAVKSFCYKAITNHNVNARPKGILLLGPPGTGKSAFAKAVGYETDRPTITLETGNLMGSLLGETESKTRRALQIVDAVSPCVLFVDEIEKQLAGGTGQHQGDNGVKAGMLGAFLRWMNDHKTDVFVIATSNDISILPPELTRAQRFDAIFFVDFPNKEARQQIWDIHIQLYGIKTSLIPADDNWTGAEIESCCRLSALLDINLTNAADLVVPIATTQADKINALRQQSVGRYLCATNNGLYSTAKASPNGTMRTLRKRTPQANEKDSL